MSSVLAALEDLRLQDVPNVSDTARRYGVCRKNLSKRWKGTAGSVAEKATSQRLLSLQQERTLLDYINYLTSIGLPPTPAMLRNFATDILGQPPGHTWCSRFCKRWSSELLSRYLTPLDTSRKKADSIEEYRYWFDLVDAKIKQYDVQEHNMYNMDEKGFSIGVMNKSRRIFTKAQFNSGSFIGHQQDGNREWITLAATVCADGTSLPPGLIYMAVSGDIQDSWVQELDPSEHTAHFASSPTGWTNDHLGFEWLTKIFDRYTKQKARQGRDYRLLFVDGHSSHLNMKFLDWCLEHKILVAVYPPHSTHRLQPLDVSMFSPLSTYYSQELDNFTSRSRGTTRLTKREFHELFWIAYQKAFTKVNIQSSWMKTGLHPFDPSQVMKIFDSIEATTDQCDARPISSQSQASALSASEWRAIRKLMKEVVSEVHDTHDSKVNQLNNTMLHLTTEISLLRSENIGMRQALYTEQKRRKRGKGLFEEIRAVDGHGATFFSPMKIEQAKAQLLSKDQAKEATLAQKVIQKELKTSRLIEEQKLKDQRKIERLQKKEESDRAKALKVEQKAAKEAAQLLQLSPIKAPQKVPRKVKGHQKRSLHQKLVLLESQAPRSPQAPLQAVSRVGRVTRLPQHLLDCQVDK
jgi:hypothetical protein